MAGARYGRRRQTLRARGEGGVDEVDGDRKRSGEGRTPCGTRCFWYDETDTGSPGWADVPMQ